MAAQLKVTTDSDERGVTIEVVENGQPPTPPNGGGIMQILLKLWAIYQAIKAKDYAKAWALFLELIGSISTASDADHADAEAAFQAFQAFQAGTQKPK